MKTKNYIGTSRPCGEYDKQLLGILENNLNYFNICKKKGILSVEHYVDNGDQWKVMKDGKDILVDMTLEQAYCVVAAIISYARKELK